MAKQQQISKQGRNGPRKQANYVKPKKKQGYLKNTSYERNLRGIQQGVGATVPRPFGNSKGLAFAFDATHPNHMALPVATGPYTTMRVTQLINSSLQVIAFGTFKGSSDTINTTLSPPTQTSREGWAPYCAVESDNGGAAAPITVSRFYKMAALEKLGELATIVPSALTVQIMNPEALQTSNGIVYIGRMKTQFRGEDATASWDSLANEFVSYQEPRLCSAGKLALRGIKVSAAPFNIQELQDFDRIVDPIDTAGSGPHQFGWTSTSQPDGTDAINPRWKMKGFSPIMVYNPNNISLQYLVTMEIRCRYDLGHPASSSHTHHRPSTEGDWANKMKGMYDMGAGAMDIADSVAQMGELASRASPYMAGLAAAF